MGKFVFKNQALDEYVEKQLQIVVEEIKKEISDLYSIIIIGGFGRGEGAVQIVDGEPQLVNDFDLYIITEKQHPDHFLTELGVRCAKLIGKGGLQHPEGFEKEYTFDEFFHVDVHNLTKKSLPTLPPTTRYFEMPRSVTVLYGEDVRSLFPKLTAEQIPYPEALRLLMNRMMLLIMSMQEEFLQQKKLPTRDEANIIKYYVAKGYLTICEALLIHIKQFDGGYLKRLEVFREHYEEFKDIRKEIPDLLEKVEKFTLYKVQPDPRRFDALKVWKECRKDMGIVFSYCLSFFIGKELSLNWVENYTLLEKELPQKYFSPYAAYLLAKKHLNISPLRSLVSKGGQVYMSWKYFSALKDRQGKASLSYFHFTDPGVLILALCPLVLFSISDEGVVNKEMILKGWKHLERLFPLPHVEQLTWETFKTEWLKAYRTYYLMKFV